MARTQAQTSLVMPLLLTMAVSALVFGVGGYLIGKHFSSGAPELYSAPQPDTIRNHPTTGATAMPAPAAASPTPGMAVYQDSQYGFQFQYPIAFIRQATTEQAVNANQNAILADFKSTEGNEFEVSLDPAQFSVSALKKYAPTGSEEMEPVAQTIGQNTFYYYGPGGGGVCYPDQYFLNLSGKTLVFTFSAGCENDRTPADNFKKIESQILASYKGLSL